MNVELLDVGFISFHEARVLQNELVLKRQQDLIPDTWLFCEHPLTLSLGKRTSKSDFIISLDEWCLRGAKIVESDRGGAATVHLPGQLMIYPVVKLERKFSGIKTFVEGGLSLLQRVVQVIGLNAESLLEPAGLYISGKGKLASVGLKISERVTNHGFSLNVSCDLTPFAWLHPCGLRGVNATSMLACGVSAGPEEVRVLLRKELNRFYGVKLSRGGVKNLNC